jgi:opacity protein-like surface antigen
MPEVTVTEATGWYLRGDVGYGFTDLRGAKYFQGSNATKSISTTADLRDAFTVGGGVGYQVNSYFART